MIDLHTHILPKMDDGSRSVTESLALLKAEAEQGVDTVVCTPHFYADQNDPIQFLERRQTAWECLQPALQPGMPEICLGAEVQYFSGISRVDSVSKLRIEGSNLLLVEMPFHKWSDWELSEIADLNGREDVQVVLAHIERYLDMQSRDIMDRLLRNGLLIQSNASFFRNWKTKHKAMRMLKHGEIHFIGSDCHNMSARPPNMGGLADSVYPRLPCIDIFHYTKV